MVLSCVYLVDWNFHFSSTTIVELPSVDSCSISYHLAADNMSSGQRTERDTTQCLHPYRDFRSIMIPNVPHISLNPPMSLEDLESAVCQSDTTSTRRAEPPKLSDYSPEEIEVINSARRRVIMDMITINGWKKNSMRKQKLAMHLYAREVVN